MKSSTCFVRLLFTTLLCVSGATLTYAQVPQIINYQGHISVGDSNFNGSGQFKFVLVDGGSNGTFNTFWSNDGSSGGGSQPASSVLVPVNQGFFTIALGDSTVSNMVPVLATIFTNPVVNLRIWFSDGTNGTRLLVPDQRLTSVGYALMANSAVNVPDGSITSAKLAPAAVNGVQIASGSISATQLATSVASGLMTLQVPSVTNIQALANNSYVFTNTGVNQLKLPANPNVGDRVRVAGGAGGFTLIANTGQSVYALAAFTWKPRGSNDQYRVASSSDGSKLAVTQFGNPPNNPAILTSTNYGMTWTQQTNFSLVVGPYGTSGWQCIASSADGSRLVAGQEYGGLFSSTSYGLNWSQLNGAGIGFWFSVASASDGSELLAGGNHEYFSTDYGEDWTYNTVNNGNQYGGSFAAMSTNGSVLYDDTLISTNGGSTWSGNGFPAGNNSVACSGNGQRVLAGQSSGYLYVSADGAKTALACYTAGSNNWQCVAMSADGQTLAAGQAGGYLYESHDSGNTWTQQTAAGVGNWSSIALSSDGTRLIAGQNSGSYFVKPNFITANSIVYVYAGAYANLELVYMGVGLWVPAFCTGSFSIQ